MLQMGTDGGYEEGTWQRAQRKSTGVSQSDQRLVLWVPFGFSALQQLQH